MQGRRLRTKELTLLLWRTDFLVRPACLWSGQVRKTLYSRIAGTNVQSAERIGSIRCLTPRALRLTCITESVLAVVRRHRLHLLEKLTTLGEERRELHAVLDCVLAI